VKSPRIESPISNRPAHRPQSTRTLQPICNNNLQVVCRTRRIPESNQASGRTVLPEA